MHNTICGSGFKSQTNPLCFLELNKQTIIDQVIVTSFTETSCELKQHPPPPSVDFTEISGGFHRMFVGPIVLFH